MDNNYFKQLKEQLSKTKNGIIVYQNGEQKVSEIESFFTDINTNIKNLENKIENLENKISKILEYLKKDV